MTVWVVVGVLGRTGLMDSDLALKANHQPTTLHWHYELLLPKPQSTLAGESRGGCVVQASIAQRQCFENKR